LRSYDHCHRQREVDAKKISARNEPEKGKKKRGIDDMRPVAIDTANKRPAGLGPRFTKVTGGAAGAGGGRFKKVGVVVSEGKQKEDDAAKKESDAAQKQSEEDAQLAELLKQQEAVRAQIERLQAEKEKKAATESPRPVPTSTAQTPAPAPNADQDVAMAGIEEPEHASPEKHDEETAKNADAGEEAITWEEYDFTKPTGCDHATCPGCKTDGIWEDDFLEDEFPPTAAPRAAEIS
jgi:hypothetical protein